MQSILGGGKNNKTADAKIKILSDKSFRYVWKERMDKTKVLQDGSQYQNEEFSQKWVSLPIKIEV